MTRGIREANRMGYKPENVKDAIDRLTTKLACGPSNSLQQEFEAGLHPTLLSYDKIEPSQVQVPIITRYLVGATSYLHQPANFYNIFSVCRCVNIVQILDAAIACLVDHKVYGLEKRLDRLRQEKLRDAFDSVAFELITAAHYATHPSVDEVVLLDELPPQRTPDFLVHLGPLEMFVECKKIDRTQEFTMAIRNAARDCLNPVFSFFRLKEISVLADVTFHCDPRTVNVSTLIDACHASLKERTAIINSEFTALAVPLPKYQSGDVTLYPSPKFSWERYGYRVRSEWVGMVNQLEGRSLRMANVPSALQGGMSTWIDDVHWDCGAKWKVSDDCIMAKYRRFAFNGIFSGLDQLKDRGLNTALHVWLESDYYSGGRKNTFMDLFRRLANARRHFFGWLIINETIFDVSPRGVFDLIEHGHSIRGPAAIIDSPIVSIVFVPTDSTEGIGEFGVGVELPDADD